MLLGSFTLAPSTNHRVVLSGVANGVIIADAVAFVPNDALPNTATWQPTIVTSGDYEVHGKWPAHANHPSNAPFTIYHAGGNTTVPTNQQINGGQWNLLGTFTFEPNEDHRIELTDQANGVVIADAVAVAPVEAPPNTAIWVPTILVPYEYEVYAKWPAHATHPSAAPYTVYHASGSTTVLMNQQTNGGQWNLVGTFTLQPGQNHRIELTDQATGVVIADAVKFVPAPNTASTATWTPTIATSDSYQVYTRWTSHHNRATDATYTIHHQGGSSTVVVNQQENGGEWQLLGTYNLAPGSNHRIELSDQANGVVVADAVYVVPASATPNNVTWTPTLASSETVDVYAQWVDGADRSDSVTYTVHHAGGSTTMNLNQRINGGAWNFLGRFTMNPASNHRVELTDSTNGVVVADAVRFVSVTASGAGLMYVHSDHLGTPQKMTNGSQTLMWDAVYEPFGETHSITGTASNNQRFPGQCADQESGFSYNYFRDYDSTTGRYVQSDPIGLVGGHNRYAYGFGNPISLIDFYGLKPLPNCLIEFLQPFFPDLDLDQIDIHADSIPTELAETFNFDAFTYGNDIYFYDNQFNPDTVSGVGLIGHELTHAEQYANASGYDDFLGDYLLEWLVNGYENNAYEIEATNTQNEVMSELMKNMGGISPCSSSKKKRCSPCPGEKKC